MKLYSATYYHGSGVNFDKFDFKFMGTGEGAQVHGWGIYLAQDIETAEGYRNKLDGSYDSDSTLKEKGFEREDIIKAIELVKSHRITNILTLDELIKYKDIYENLQWVIDEAPEDCNPYETVAIVYDDDTVHFFHDRNTFVFYSNPLPPWGAHGDYTPETCLLFVEYNHSWDGSWKNSDQWRYIEVLEKNLKSFNEGMVATVRVDDDCTFIDEDEPLKDMLYFNSVLKSIWDEFAPDAKPPVVNPLDEMNFREWYFTLSDYAEPKDISMALLEEGIDGIRYNGNRDGECLVLFNLDKCEIIEKE